MFMIKKEQEMNCHKAMISCSSIVMRKLFYFQIIYKNWECKLAKIPSVIVIVMICNISSFDVCGLSRCHHFIATKMFEAIIFEK